MSNQPKEKNNKNNSPNIYIELSDNKEHLYDSKNNNEKMKGQYEDVEDETVDLKMFSKIPIEDEENLTFSEKKKRKIFNKKEFISRYFKYSWYFII